MDDGPPPQPEPPRSPGPAPGPGLDAIDATGRLGPDRLRWLLDHGARALAPLGLTGEVRLRIVADAEMAEAHERWAGVSGATDVLTFDMRDSTHGPLDTDILACLDEAERRAAELGHSPERELLLYLVHGVLHCLGHDDHDPAAAERMHALEDDLLDRAGVGPTYDPSRAGAPEARP